MLIFLGIVFQLICEVFWLKIRKLLKLEKLENMMKKQSILRKRNSFKTASLPEWECAKYAGGSRSLTKRIFRLIFNEKDWA